MIIKRCLRRRIIERLSNDFIEEMEDTINSTRFNLHDKEYYITRILFFENSLNSISKLYKEKFEERLNERNDYQNKNEDAKFYKFMYESSLNIYDMLNDNELVKLIKELKINYEIGMVDEFFCNNNDKMEVEK